VSAHYTAVLKVTRTTPPVPLAASGARHIQASPPKVEREVDELASIIVRADSLVALTAKLTAHVALIDE
jgi:hypothetical protein